MSDSESQSGLGNASTDEPATDGEPEAEQTSPEDDTQDQDNPWNTWERGSQEFVTIRKGGAIAPNSTVYERYCEDAEAVLLNTHEEKDDIIGIKPIDHFDEDNKEHYRINGDSSGGASIHGRGFLKEHGFDHDESRRYTPEWDEEFEVLVIDLSEDGEVVSQSNSSDDDS